MHLNLRIDNIDFTIERYTNDAKITSLFIGLYSCDVHRITKFVNTLPNLKLIIIDKFASTNTYIINNTNVPNLFIQNIPIQYPALRPLNRISINRNGPRFDKFIMNANIYEVYIRRPLFVSVLMCDNPHVGVVDCDDFSDAHNHVLNFLIQHKQYRFGGNMRHRYPKQAASNDRYILQHLGGYKKTIVILMHKLPRLPKYVWLLILRDLLPPGTYRNVRAIILTDT